MFKKFLRKLTGKESNELETTLSEMGGKFDSYEAADAHFKKEIETNLDKLETLQKEFPHLNLNFKAKSLLPLEQLYFEIFKDKKRKSSLSKASFENLITYYLREIFIRNKMAEWKIEQFQEGSYILGILYGYGSWTNEHYAENLNKQKSKNRDYLYNYFMDFVPEEREGEV